VRRLWLACLSLALASCQAVDDTDAAQAAVEAFHRDYDSERFAAVFEKSGAELKRITPRAQFLDFMTAVRTRLGEVKSTRQTGWNVNYNTGGGQITLTYETVFANGEATETFVYDTASPPRLIGYNVNAPALAGR
jgi:hypothetical protein